MSRSRRTPRLLFVGVLLAAIVGLVTVLVSGAAARPNVVSTHTGTLPDGAQYEIQVPSDWNGTLFLYSHGYVVPGSANPAQDVGDPITGQWLLDHGYALAGSSYASTGWAIQQALPDQIDTLTCSTDRGASEADDRVGPLAGRDHHGRADSAVSEPLRCRSADVRRAVRRRRDLEHRARRRIRIPDLVAPSVQVTNITNPVGNLTAADSAAATAQQTAQGRARLSLVAALGDTPGWFTPLSPEPAANDYTAQEANQFQWATQVDFPFAFALRAELEARAGGNPSWNTGVNYIQDFARSADAREVRALYRAAGLNLRSDLRTLNNTARISADPAAVRYLERNIIFNGRLSIPVLTMHTTGDGLVVPENEQAYRQVVRQAGDSQLLRQIFVARAGHCAFTPAETITAAQDLLHRLDTGSLGRRCDQPQEAQRVSCGARLDIQRVRLGRPGCRYAAGVRALPATPYLRPFDATSRPHGGRHHGGRHHGGRQHGRRTH